MGDVEKVREKEIRYIVVQIPDFVSDKIFQAIFL